MLTIKDKFCKATSYYIRSANPCFASIPYEQSVAHCKMELQKGFETSIYIVSAAGGIDIPKVK